MEFEQAKQLIGETKNIYIIPAQTNEPESIVCALALFYTLKELNKNVNLVIEELPEKFKRPVWFVGDALMVHSFYHTQRESLEGNEQPILEFYKQIVK